MCIPYCNPPQIWTGTTCVCEDGTPVNSVGHCCPDPLFMDPETGICGCELENMERLCRSRNPDADCDDTCVCVNGVTFNGFMYHDPY